MGGLLDLFIGAIGFVITGIVSAFEFVVDLFTEGPWAAITNFLGNMWVGFRDNILEPIMSFLGITGETYYETFVYAAKIYDEDLLQIMLVQNIVKYVTNNLSVTAYLKLFADVGDAQFSAYYRYGQWYYIDYLPETQVTSVSVPSSTIKEIIQEQRGEEVYIIKTSVVGVHENTWCKWYLQENYDYNVGEDFVVINGNYYQFTSATYDENTATYIALLTEISSILVRVYEIVTVEVSDELSTDSTYTYTYTTTTLYINTSVTTESGPYTTEYTTDNGDGSYTLHRESGTLTQKYITSEGNLISSDFNITSSTTSTVYYETEESYTYTIETSETTTESWAYIIQYEEVITYEADGSTGLSYVQNRTLTWEPYTNQTAGTVVSGPVIVNNGSFYVVYTTTTTDTRYYRADTGSYIMSSSTSEVSISYATTGAGSTSTTTTLLESYYITNTNPGTYTVSVPYFNSNQRMYQVLYSTPSTGRQYYWIYDPSTGELDNLNEPVASTQDLEVYPICCLRISGEDITHYETSEVPEITEERYNSSVELLSRIGLSVDDLIEAYNQNDDEDEYGNAAIDYMLSVFFLFAIAPTNTAEIVSKVLYTMFEGIYTIMPYTTEITLSSDSAMAMAVKEHPFKAVCSWIPLPQVEQEEVIGSLGYCTHELRTNRVTSTDYSVLIVVNNGDGTYTRTTYIETVSEDMYGTNLGSVMSDYETTTVKGNAASYTIREELEGGSTTSSSKDLIVKKQITATTTNTIIVFSFVTANFIEANVGTFVVSLDADDEHMIFPLPVKVVEALSILEKTALLGEACYLLFYGIQEIALEWYETEAFAQFMQIFQVLIIIASVVLSIWTGGASLSMISVITTLAKATAIAVGTSLALQLISEFIDDTALKVVLSMAVMVVAFWAGGGFNNILDSFDFTKAVNLVTMPIKAIQLVTNDLMSDLQAEYNSFMTEYETRSEEYEAIMDELNEGLSTEAIVDIMTEGGMHSNNDSIVSAIVYSPSAFYSMTFDYYRDFDTLYDGLYDSTVGSFVSNKLKIGIVGDSATGVDDSDE